MNSQPTRTDPPAVDFFQAVAASGLVNAEALGNAVSATRGNGEALAEALVRDNLLTRFQADALREGRGDMLSLGNYDILDRLVRAAWARSIRPGIGE